MKHLALLLEYHIGEKFGAARLYRVILTIIKAGKLHEHGGIDSYCVHAYSVLGIKFTYRMGLFNYTHYHFHVECVWCTGR